MTLLYLVDGGQAIPFALNKRNGVLVTSLRGQLTVVSAPDIDRPKEEANLREEAKAIIPDPIEPMKVPPYPQKLSLPVAGNQFTLLYNGATQHLVIIGVTDIDGAIRKKEAPGTVTSLFSLQSQIVNIRRFGDRLEFLVIPF